MFVWARHYIHSCILIIYSTFVKQTFINIIYYDITNYNTTHYKLKVQNHNFLCRIKFKWQTRLTNRWKRSCEISVNHIVCHVVSDWCEISVCDCKASPVVRQLYGHLNEGVWTQFELFDKLFSKTLEVKTLDVQIIDETDRRNDTNVFVRRANSILWLYLSFDLIEKYLSFTFLLLYYHIHHKLLLLQYDLQISRNTNRYCTSQNNRGHQTRVLA